MTARLDTDSFPTEVGSGTERRRWLPLGVLTIAVMLDGFVNSIGAAGHAIQQSLHVPDVLMPEVLYGYGLVFLLVLLPAGRLADLVGHRRVFLVGAATFTLASALCGLAPNAVVLAGARLLQGAGAAAMIPQVLSAIMIEFAPREQRQRVAGYGLYGVVVAFIAPSAGLMADALIRTDLFGLGWRMLFLLAVPVSASMWLVAVRVLPPGRPASPPRFDWLGTVLLVIGLLLLVYPLSVGGGLGWPAWTFATVAMSAPVFALLVWQEVRRSRRDGSALAVPGLFRDRAFGGGMVAVVVMSFAILGFFPFFAAYLNTGLGFSLGQVWLASVGWSVGILVTSAVDVWVAPRIGRGVFVLGMAVMTVSIATLIPIFHGSGPGVTWQQIAPALFVAGLGKGIMTPALIDVVLAGVPRRDTGSASGILLAVQQVGGNVGFAVLGAVLVGVLAGQAAVVPNSAVVAAVRDSGVPAAAEDSVVASFQLCLHDRVTQSDPIATPASCARAVRDVDGASHGQVSGQRIQAEVSAAADGPRRSGVAKAIERGLWYEVAMLVVSTALMLLLPPGNRRGSRERGRGLAA